MGTGAYWWDSSEGTTPIPQSRTGFTSSFICRAVYAATVPTLFSAAHTAKASRLLRDTRVGFAADLGDVSCSPTFPDSHPVCTKSLWVCALCCWMGLVFCVGTRSVLL